MASPTATKQKQRQEQYERKLAVVIDMETGDPDDLLTLMFAACHPRVDLRAVTLTPGSEQQAQLVRHVLATLFKDSNQWKKAKKKTQQGTVVRLGCQEWPKHRMKKGCVNLKFYETFLYPLSSESEQEQEEGKHRGKGKRIKHKKSATPSRILPVASRHVDETTYPAADLIRDVSQELHGKVTILTGGPLHNLAAALSLSESISFERWVGQGGFCGHGVVPDGVPTLAKFAGLTHVQTWNFGGSKQATMLALDTEKIERRVLVGKNVCHRCTYDKELADRLMKRCERSTKEDHDDPSHTTALRWVEKAMSSRYCGRNASCGGGGESCNGKRRSNKALHDPLALATMLDERTCSLREVDVIQSQEEGGSIVWGSRLTEEGSRTFAAVDYDHSRFVDTLLWE